MVSVDAGEVSVDVGCIWRSDILLIFENSKEIASLGYFCRMNAGSGSSNSSSSSRRQHFTINSQKRVGEIGGDSVVVGKVAKSAERERMRERDSLAGYIRFGGSDRYREARKRWCGAGGSSISSRFYTLRVFLLSLRRPSLWRWFLGCV